MRWKTFSRTDVDLEVLEANGHPTQAVQRYLRSIPRGDDDFLTVVIPEVLAKASLWSALRHRRSFALKLRLLREPQIVITDVPVVRGSNEDEADVRPLIPQRTVALLFVAAANDATVRAANYALALRASDTRAVFIALDTAEVDEIQREWEELRIPMQLDIVEAPFRDLTGPLLEEVRRVTAEPESIAAVIVPELIVSRRRHQILHNQRPLFIKRLLLFEPNVILSSVPLQVR